MWTYVSREVTWVRDKELSSIKNYSSGGIKIFHRRNRRVWNKINVFSRYGIKIFQQRNKIVFHIWKKKNSTHGKNVMATCHFRVFFQNNFEVSIDLFGHVAVNAQRFNVKSFLQDRKKESIGIFWLCQDLTTQRFLTQILCLIAR